MSQFVNDILRLNIECFTSDDPYSSGPLLHEIADSEEKGFLVAKDKGKVVGYIIYAEYDSHIESLRRGVTRECRGKGIGKRLAKKLIALSNKTGKPIFTYVAAWNLASLNSNIRCGYTIRYIEDGWVHIKYAPKS